MDLVTHIVIIISYSDSFSSDFNIRPCRRKCWHVEVMDSHIARSSQTLKFQLSSSSDQRSFVELSPHQPPQPKPEASLVKLCSVFQSSATIHEHNTYQAKKPHICSVNYVTYQDSLVTPCGDNCHLDWDKTQTDLIYSLGLGLRPITKLFCFPFSTLPFARGSFAVIHHCTHYSYILFMQAISYIFTVSQNPYLHIICFVLYNYFAKCEMSVFINWSS